MGIVTRAFNDKCSVGGGKFAGADALKPVGLLFAGSSTTTLANPIDVVLDRFGVTIDGQ